MRGGSDRSIEINFHFATAVSWLKQKNFFHFYKITALREKLKEAVQAIDEFWRFSDTPEAVRERENRID
jgi:hypothetical protein